MSHGLTDYQNSEYSRGAIYVNKCTQCINKAGDKGLFWGRTNNLHYVSRGFKMPIFRKRGCWWNEANLWTHHLWGQIWHRITVIPCYKGLYPGDYILHCMQLKTCFGIFLKMMCMWAHMNNFESAPFPAEFEPMTVWCSSNWGWVESPLHCFHRFF